jgi:hypothetical protein
MTLPHHPRTTVYVDGFNFYYAAFRGKRPRAARLKWLDMWAFSRLLLPEHDVRLVRYFTAAVKPVEWDSNQHLRQVNRPGFVGGSRP